MTTGRRQRIVIALARAAAAAALAMPVAPTAPALAQFSAGRAALGERALAEPVQFREFFRPFWEGGYPAYPSYPSYPQPQYNPFYPRPQVYEPTKPPPPRKAETPPSETIWVIGDSLAEWLAYGLEETFADTPEVGIVRKIKPTSGLVRYEGHADGPDFAQAVRDMPATEKPAAIVVMLGINDRLPLRERAPAPEKDKDKKGAAAATAPDSSSDDAASPRGADQSPAPGAAEKDRRSPGGPYEFHTDQWGELYEKRIDEMIAALKGKGVPVIWVGLPAVRGTKSTSDMSYLDELYRARAEKAGITYIDTWDGFVDDKGQFAVQGPDFEGQTRRLRTSDGVNFTKAGAEKLARYVERDLRRILSSHAVPVALPGPEEQAPAKGNARPAIGPIVPLTASTGGEGGELLGTGSRQVQHESDPVATQVLSRGEAIAAPHGRADDFSWPRPDASSAADPMAAPAAGGKIDAKTDAGKADGIKADAKKASEAKNEGKAAAPAVTKPRRPGAALDGAPPRPPLPVGPSRD